MSRYADKQERLNRVPLDVLLSYGISRPARNCSHCKRRLRGKKGHGFPSVGGRGIYCGACVKLPGH